MNAETSLHPSLPVVRLALLGVLSWFLSLLALLGVSAFYHREVPSADDITGYALASLVGGVVLVSLSYVPGLLWVRRWTTGSRPWLLALVTAVGLNVPGFGVLLAADRVGHVFGPGEAYLLAFALTTMGAIFGWGFARIVGR